jgi:hypothetical protein
VNPLIIFLSGLITPNAPLVDDVLSRWEGAGLEVEVVSVHCGDDNAAYYPATKLIVMCDDLYDRPELASWILSHELAHAFMWQHDVPQRRGTKDQERVADELAFLTTEPAETYAAARWFMDLHKAHPKRSPNDPHPDPLDRAGSVLCLQQGKEGGNRTCRLYLESVQAHWMRILDWVNRP